MKNPLNQPPRVTVSTTSLSRRSFMKKTALTAGAVMIMSEGRALAQAGNSGSSTSGSIINTSHTTQQFQIVCVESPTELSGIIAWNEASVASGIANASAKSHRVDIGSDSDQPPVQGDSSTSAMRPIVARAKSSEFSTPNLVHERSTQARLRIIKNGTDSQYNGEWLELNSPETPTIKHLNWGANLPLGVTSVTLSASLGIVTSGIVKAGYFIDSLAVSGGANITNKKEYDHGGSSSYSTRTAAELGLNASAATSASASTTKISGKSEVKNEAAAKIETEGTSTLEMNYDKKAIADDSYFYEFNGTCHSSINGRLYWSWKFKMQRRTKTCRYKNGVLQPNLTTYTNWADVP